jgi:hypothetical protein
MKPEEARQQLRFEDVDQLRGELRVSALDRVRLVISVPERETHLDMECVACELLLQWDDARDWWVCPVCQQELTTEEALEMIREAHAAMEKVLGKTDERPEPAADEKPKRQGIGRWAAGKVRGLMGS